MNIQTNRKRGHTLLELLVAMFVMAILVAAAIPFYGEYTIKGKVSAMHDTLLLGANAEDRFFSAHKRYGSTNELAVKGYLAEMKSHAPIAIDAMTPGKSLIATVPAYTALHGWNYAIVLTYDLTDSGGSRLGECWAYFSTNHPSGYGGELVHLYDDTNNRVATPSGYSSCQMCPQVTNFCALPSGG